MVYVLVAQERGVMVENGDVEQAAEYVLGHRHCQQPFNLPQDQTQDMEDKLDELCNNQALPKNPDQGSRGSSKYLDPSSNANNDDTTNDDGAMQTFTTRKPN